MVMFSCRAQAEPPRFDPTRFVSISSMILIAGALGLTNILLFTSNGDFMFR